MAEVGQTNVITILISVLSSSIVSGIVTNIIQNAYENRKIKYNEKLSAYSDYMHKLLDLFSKDETGKTVDRESLHNLEALSSKAILVSPDTLVIKIRGLNAKLSKNIQEYKEVKGDSEKKETFNKHLNEVVILREDIIYELRKELGFSTNKSSILNWIHKKPSNS